VIPESFMAKLETKTLNLKSKKDFEETQIGFMTLVESTLSEIRSG
jgi:hypothetical protein